MIIIHFTTYVFLGGVVYFHTNTIASGNATGNSIVLWFYGSMEHWACYYCVDQSQRERGRKRDRDSEGLSVWKQLHSNLAANLLPFSLINLKRENGPRRA